MVKSERGFRGVYATYPKECLSLCDKAVEIKPAEPELYFYRGNVLYILRIGKKQEEEVLQNNSSESSALLKKAMTDFYKAIELGYSPNSKIKGLRKKSLLDYAIEENQSEFTN